MPDEKKTSFITICLILLRAIRIERKYTQAQIADLLNKSTSVWTKIENGKTPLTFELLLRWSRAMWVNLPQLINTAERYAQLFTSGYDKEALWSVTFSVLEEGEDDLLLSAIEYWKSPGFKTSIYNPYSGGILNSPQICSNGSLIISPVFQFALDPIFRQGQLNATIPSPLN